MKVWHDPGHGGSNKGLVHDGFVERDWVVEIAHDLVPVLGSLGAEQRIARVTDETLRYAERARAASEWGAQLALIHHVNGMFFPPGHERAGEARPDFDGLMCFALVQDETGTEVAEAIMRSAPRRLRRQKTRPYLATPHDWTRDAYGHLIHYGRQHIPALLIEWGFATSPTDRSILTSAIHRPSLCAAAAAGVARWIELRHAA